jgi:hypothetical protein
MIRPSEAQIEQFSRELRRDVLPCPGARWFECPNCGLLEADGVAADDDGHCCASCLSAVVPSDVF